MNDDLMCFWVSKKWVSGMVPPEIFESYKKEVDALENNRIKKGNQKNRKD